MPYVSGKGELKKVYHLRIRTPYGSSQSAWADGTCDAIVEKAYAVYLSSQW